MGMLCCKTTFSETKQHFYFNILLLLPALFRVLYSAVKSSTRVSIYATSLLHKTEGDWYKNYHLHYFIVPLKSYFTSFQGAIFVQLHAHIKCCIKYFSCNQISTIYSFHKNLENKKCKWQKKQITIAWIVNGSERKFNFSLITTLPLINMIQYCH